MANEEVELIRRLKSEGKTAIEVHKWLRDNNMPIAWIEVKKIYISV